MISQPEASEEMTEQIENYVVELERIEEEAPRYDATYHVKPDVEHTPISEKQIAMSKAHGEVREDIGDLDFVPTMTSVAEDRTPEGVYSVMVTVAAEVKKKTFERAEEVYVVESGNKTHEWCQS